MKKIYKILRITIITLSLISYGKAQTNIYTTDFGTVANVNPTGWTFTGINMNISTNSASSGYPSASGNCYLGEGNSVAFINTSATSEPTSQIGTSSAELLVNTTGFSTVTLAFGMRKSSGGYNANATYTLEWSNNGITYNTINYTEAIAGAWGLASGPGLTLPAGAGNQSTLYIRWTFVRTGTASNFKIDDVFVIGNAAANNNAPTIVMDVASTSNFLDGGVSVAPISPYPVSGVISDPSDPASTLGIDFTINDAQTAASSLTVTFVSSNLTVLPNANVVITGTAASRNIKIIPGTVGYSNITINVSDGTNITPYTINYACSAAASTPSNTIWHTGMSDASDAVAIDNNYYISGDDELDILNVYSRTASGLPLVSFDYSSFINLASTSSPEVDLEAGTRSPLNTNRIYWMGSMSTGGSSFSIRPNRDRLFATTVSGTGATTTFSVLGYYASLRTAIVNWGDANGYNFSASAAAGMDSKNIAGYAAEGMVFAPDNITLYVGLRAPLVPIANRTKAVIVPLTNFETWFNNGSPSGNPTLGAPIELNLGGRGIRDLVRLTNGVYIILAGNPAGSPLTSAIYKWTGNATDAPLFIATPVNGFLNMEGVMQGIGSAPVSATPLQIISDGGGDIIYNDGNAAKDLADLNLRKFRLDNLSAVNLCILSATSTPVITQAGFSFTSTPGVSYQWYYNSVAITGATLQTYNAAQNGNYFVAVTDAGGCSSTSAVVVVNTVGFTNYIGDKNVVTIFPNPYNESTSIELVLAENSRVIIEVYSLLGQKIQSIANADYFAGKHTFSFGAVKLGYAAGMYLIKTAVNNNTIVTRVIEN
ncbi:MAG: T9SS type A sorting domain-containing protein [Bacteroidetes bacterium]|nr:T9SS type A sorting domain-containing protein [Bacteroidota bacterium]